MLGDVINVIVIRALAKYKLPLQRMMECYRYDLSVVDSADLDDHGCFADAYLDRYWVEEGPDPFLVRIQGQLAGRALINCYTYMPDWRIS